MSQRSKFILSVVLVVAAILGLLAIIFINSDKIAVLNPQGLIGLKERNLIYISLGLMLIVVIPVFIMTTLFAWKYRASNINAKHEPNWDHSLLAEAVWWGVPGIIILILSVIIWQSSHELDPFRPIESEKKPLKIQVVALQWKWLFLYPEQGVATLNFLRIPEKTPIDFRLTADAPMNSFWIPQLGGQVYAMPGMETTLYLIADSVGEYRGVSANISGEGFAYMTFNTESTSEASFNEWVQSAKQSSNHLTLEEYDKLAEPSMDNPVASFSLEDEKLFSRILMRYMTPKPAKVEK